MRNPCQRDVFRLKTGRELCKIGTYKNHRRKKGRELMKRMVSALLAMALLLSCGFACAEENDGLVYLSDFSAGADG